MKNLALGAGIFIVVEVLLFFIMAIDGSVMVLFVGGSIITLLLMLLINQMELIKYNRERQNHDKRRKMDDLNQKHREMTQSESIL